MWVRVREEKGKLGPPRVLPFRSLAPRHADSCPVRLLRVLLAELPHRYVLSADTPLFTLMRLGAAQRGTPRCDTALSRAISSMLDTIGFAPPDLISYTSHSAREGAASSAHSIGISLPRIQWVGGWRSLEGVRPYIDASWPTSRAARVLFGQLIALA